MKVLSVGDTGLRGSANVQGALEPDAATATKPRASGNVPYAFETLPAAALFNALACIGEKNYA